MRSNCCFLKSAACLTVNSLVTSEMSGVAVVTVVVVVDVFGMVTVPRTVVEAGTSRVGRRSEMSFSGVSCFVGDTSGSEWRSSPFDFRYSARSSAFSFADDIIFAWMRLPRSLSVWKFW